MEKLLTSRRDFDCYHNEEKLNLGRKSWERHCRAECVLDYRCSWNFLLTFLRPHLKSHVLCSCSFSTAGSQFPAFFMQVSPSFICVHFCATLKIQKQGLQDGRGLEESASILLLSSSLLSQPLICSTPTAFLLPLFPTFKLLSSLPQTLHNQN